MTTDERDAEFLKQLTVLYVEDDPSARDEIGAFIGRRVGTLITAANGAEGLEAFRSQAPQLVITDIQMPVMDGLAMAEVIRSQNPAVPILVTTAFEQATYLIRAIELGIDRYVVKPVRAQPLESALLASARRLRAEAEMAQKRLLEAEVMRLRHHAVINTLLGGIGHDYNNLLQAILGSMDAAAASVESGSRAHQFLKTSRTASDQARLLSKRLLALAHPETSAAHPAGPVEDLVRRTVQAALEGSDVRAAFEFQAGDPPLPHDAKALETVVENLAANAREAMAGGGTLQVSTRVESLREGNDAGLAHGRHLHLAFRDEGRGIPAQDLPMVFEPYFTTKARSSQRGTGLGLAIARAHIQAHRGAIQAESTPGQGATFHLYLPLDPPE